MDSRKAQPEHKFVKNQRCNIGNILFTRNIDGIPVFKSSKYNIGPLYFAINELPIHKGWFTDDNLLLAGL